MLFRKIIMADLLLSFLEFCEKSLRDSVYMGPDGTLYEIAIMMGYMYIQAFVFFCPNFLEILPKRSTFGILVMVLAFFPGIIAKLISKKMYALGKYIKRFARNIRIIIKRKLRKRKRIKKAGYAKL